MSADRPLSSNRYYIGTTLLVIAITVTASLLYRHFDYLAQPHAGEVWSYRPNPNPFADSPKRDFRILAVKDGYVQFEYVVPSNDGSVFRALDSENIDIFRALYRRTQDAPTKGSE